MGGHYVGHRALEELVFEQTVWEGEETASSERKEEEKEGWPTRIWEMTLAWYMVVWGEVPSSWGLQECCLPWNSCPVRAGQRREQTGPTYFTWQADPVMATSTVAPRLPSSIPATGNT